MPRRDGAHESARSSSAEEAVVGCIRSTRGMDSALSSGRGPAPSRSKLRSAAQAANHLIGKAEAAAKDRKSAVAAAARLFNLAANDPSTKIEFVTADGAALPESESGSEGGAMSDGEGEEVFLEDAMAAAGFEYACADAAAWAAFWRSGPRVVAVDAEGTHRQPPLLVQICADSSRTVLLSGPSDAAVEADVARLLGDPAIAKVFFGPPRSENLGCPMANVVDVQALAARRDAGGRKVALQKGLATVAGEAVRGAPFAKHKDLQKSFRYVERRSDHAALAWLSPDQRAYAAADAWATLEVHQRLAADDDDDDDLAPAPAPAPRADAQPRGRPRQGQGAKRRARSSSGARAKRKKQRGGAALDIEISFA